jgi:hypothetical protein
LVAHSIYWPIFILPKIEKLIIEFPSISQKHILLADVFNEKPFVKCSVKSPLKGEFQTNFHAIPKNKYNRSQNKIIIISKKGSSLPEIYYLYLLKA